jgi:hypothetical protein
VVAKTVKGKKISASEGCKARYGDFRKKKRGCKTTAPKNFNHIFIEKPEPKVRVFCIWAKAILVNAIFYLGNVSKRKVNVKVK